MIKKLKTVNGITLLSLVITIVIMLILAAVSVRLIIGDNGLFTKSKMAAEVSKQKSAEEKVSLLLGEYQMDKVESDKTFDTFLNEKVADKEIESFKNNNDGTYTIKVDGYNVGVKVEDFSIIGSDKVVEVKVSRVGLNVGDYIGYTPDTLGPYTKLLSSNTGVTSNSTSIAQEKLNWQILKIYEDGSMDIIGSSTSNLIKFKGYVGYNNAVNVLNDMCKSLYSKSSVGIDARSVKVEDFENWLTPAGQNTRDTTSYCAADYGHTYTYTENNKRYPSLYAQEKGGQIDSGVSGLTQGVDKEAVKTTGLGLSDEGSASEYLMASKSLTTTQTYYYIPSIDNGSFGEGFKPLRVDSTSPYWVASRYVICNSDYAYFGIRKANAVFNGSELIDSDWRERDDNNCALRPVVHLGTSAKIQIVDGASTNPDTPHIITQY